MAMGSTDSKKRGLVLFLDSAHPSLAAGLESLGYECIFDEESSPDDLAGSMHQWSGIIVRSRFPLDSKLLGHASKLRFIGRLGSGLENIDVTYAESRGIACLNSPEGNRQAVGEHAVGMLLALLNKICLANQEVRQGLWAREKNRGLELRGRTIGIVGYGNTGSAFAGCLSGFGMEVLAYDKYKKGFGGTGVRESSMEEIRERADVLSLHVPYNQETHYLVDRDYLEAFRKSIFVVNTARGKVINTSHLLDALEGGKVLGAALDVLEYEAPSYEQINQDALPEDFLQLMKMDNVVLTPHVAGWTHESLVLLATVLLDKIRALDTPRV